MKRKHKQYSRPKRPFDKARFEEEAKIKVNEIQDITFAFDKYL